MEDPQAVDSIAALAGNQRNMLAEALGSRQGQQGAQGGIGGAALHRLQAQQPTAGVPPGLPCGPVQGQKGQVDAPGLGTGLGDNAQHQLVKETHSGQSTDSLDQVEQDDTQAPRPQGAAGPPHLRTSVAPPGAILQGTFQGQHPAAQGPAALARLAPQASAMAQAHSQNAMFAPNAGHLAQRPIIGKPMQHVFVMNGHPGFLVPVNAMPSGAAMGHHHVILHPQQVPNTHLRTYVQQGYGVQPNSGQPQLQYASGFVGRVPQQMGQGQMAMPGQMMAQAQWAHQQQLGQMGLPQYGMQAQAMPQGTAGYLAMPNGLQGAGGRGSVLPTTFKPTMPFHPNMAPQVLAFPGPQPRAKPYDTNQYTNMGADKDAGREQWAKARKVVGTQGGREDVPREGLPPRPSLSPSTPRLLPLHMLAAAAMEGSPRPVPHATNTDPWAKLYELLQPRHPGLTNVPRRARARATRSFCHANTDLFHAMVSEPSTPAQHMDTSDAGRATLPRAKDEGGTTRADAQMGAHASGPRVGVQGSRRIPTSYSALRRLVAPANPDLPRVAGTLRVPLVRVRPGRWVPPVVIEGVDAPAIWVTDDDEADSMATASGRRLGQGQNTSAPMQAHKEREAVPEALRAACAAILQTVHKGIAAAPRQLTRQQTSGIHAAVIAGLRAESEEAARVYTELQHEASLGLAGQSLHTEQQPRAMAEHAAAASAGAGGGAGAAPPPATDVPALQAAVIALLAGGAASAPPGAPPMAPSAAQMTPARATGVSGHGKQTRGAPSMGPRSSFHDRGAFEAAIRQGFTQTGRDSSPVVLSLTPRKRGRPSPPTHEPVETGTNTGPGT